MNQQAPPEQTPSQQATVRFGDRSFVFQIRNPEDYIQSLLAKHERFYEESLLADAHGRITSNDLVVDVGANIGNHSVFFAGVCGARVVAIEPFPMNFALLEENVAANALDDRVQCLKVAAGEQSGHGETLDEDALNRGAVQVRPVQRETDLEIVPLDDLNLDSPALLKIDVEGQELAVLRGARRLLATFRPLVYVEVLSAEEFDQVESYLGELGYGVESCFNFTATVLFTTSPSGRTDLGRRYAHFYIDAHERLGHLNRRIRQADGIRSATSSETEDVGSNDKRSDELHAQASHLAAEQERNRLLAAKLSDSKRDHELALEGMRSRQLLAEETAGRFRSELEASEEALRTAQGRQQELSEQNQTFRSDLEASKEALRTARGRQQELSEQNQSFRSELHASRQAAEVLRAQLDEAQDLERRAVEAQHLSKEQLDRARKEHHLRETTLASDLLRATKNHSRLRAQLERTRTALGDERDRASQLDQQRDDLEKHLAHTNLETSEEIWASQAAKTRIERSTRYRAGALLASAAARPRRWLTLPFQLLRLARSSPDIDPRSILELSQEEAVASRFSLTGRSFYTLSGTCFSGSNDEARAAIVRIEFLSTNGSVIPGPYVELATSEDGHPYRYLRASPRGSSFRILLCPPDNSKALRLSFRKWSAGSQVFLDRQLWLVAGANLGDQVLWTEHSLSSGEQSYGLGIRAISTSPVAKAAIAVVEFLDDDGVLDGPIPGFARGDDNSWFRYLGADEGHGRQSLLPVAPPEGARRVRVGFRRWRGAAGMRIDPALRLTNGIALGSDPLWVETQIAADRPQALSGACTLDSEDCPEAAIMIVDFQDASGKPIEGPFSGFYRAPSGYWFRYLHASRDPTQARFRVSLESPPAAARVRLGFRSWHAPTTVMLHSSLRFDSGLELSSAPRWIERALDSDRSYLVSGSCVADVEDGKSALALVEFSNREGTPIKGPYYGLAYSEQFEHYYCYLAGSNDGTPFRLDLDPPVDTANVRLGFRTWKSRSNVHIAGDLELEHRGASVTALGRRERGFEEDFAQFTTDLASSQAEHLVVMFGGTTFIQRIRANRPIRLTQSLIGTGTPVLFNFHRWRNDEHIPRYREQLLFQSPTDLTPELVKRVLATAPLPPKRLLVVSYPHPSVARLINLANTAGWATLYDCRDDWEEFAKVGAARWYSRALEEYVVNNCDRTCCVSQPLCDKMQTYTDHYEVRLSPNAFDPDFVSPDYQRRPDPKPRIGYFGHLTPQWFDWESLLWVARERPEYHFEIIGHGAPDSLEMPANVQLLGAMEPPGICQRATSWSAAIIPFRMNVLADAVDPIKIYEYLGLGLPVVSFRMPQIASYPATRMVESRDDFSRALDKAVTEPIDQAAIARFLADNTWDLRAAQMLQWADEILDQPSFIKSLVNR